MDDKAIEQEIQAKGKTAPRVTPADIEANIVRAHYFTAGHAIDHLPLRAQTPEEKERHPDGMPLYMASEALHCLTFCVLELRNGFTVTGESACASPENFDAEIGRQIARQNAVAKIWPLMGYELRTNLANA